MNDIENVIEGLEYCKDREGSCINCPGRECWCDEAIKLLKEQEERIRKFESERSWDENPDAMGRW